jgi:hypothetical protein
MEFFLCVCVCVDYSECDVSMGAQMVYDTGETKETAQALRAANPLEAHELCLPIRNIHKRNLL